MRKYFFMIMAGLFLLQQSKAQSPVYDALYLHSILDNTGRFPLSGRDTVYSILFKYLPEDAVEFGDFNSANPFMKPYFPGSGVYNGPQEIRSLMTSFVSSVGNLDVTNIADGLTKFLIERAKEELSIAFFDQMKKDLANEKYEDLRIIFPQTYRTLQLIDQKIYQYNAYLTSLREVFILDLTALPNTLPLIIHKPAYADYFQKHPSLKLAIQFGIISSNYLINKNHIRHVGVVIDSLLQPDLLFPVRQPANTLNNANADINGSIKTLQLISRSLRSSDTTVRGTPAATYWLRFDSLQLLLSNPDALQIYLGLLYQQAQNMGILFSNNRSLTQIFDTIAANRQSIKMGNLIYEIYASFNQYESYRQQVRTVQSGTMNDSLSVFAMGLINSSVDILEKGMALCSEWLPHSASTLQTFAPIARSMSEVYLYIPQKKYGLAVLSAAHLYQRVFEGGKDAGVGSLSSFQKISRKLVLYGTFMAEVSTAENSDQVKEIIKRTALPTGSSYIKKQSKFNIALNAYIGGFWGNEFLAEKNQQQWGSIAGVYAPVGINFSKGILNNKGKSFGSASVLLNIIDLGTFASFRLQDATTASLPEVQLKNIFAPGLGIIYGLPKVPLSIGYTYQLGPTLREINPDVIVASEKLNRRWQFFIGVDIPLFNFYNKPR